MRAVLIGNYGVGNLGDEALKEYFLKRFPDVKWSVLSANPQEGEFHRLPAGLRSLMRPWWRTLRVLRKSEGVVFGGGSLFTDTESVYACLLWWWHAFVARLFGKQLHLAFQGIGPFRTRLGEACARWVVKRAASISVRDTHSFNRIAGWEKNTKVVQTGDPVIVLIQAENTGGSSKNVLIIIPRHNSNERFIKRAQDLSQEYQWDEIHTLSLQPEDSGEQNVCQRMSEVCSGEGQVRCVYTLEGLSREVMEGSFILTQRYHGALAAIVLGKEYEVLEQKEGDKLSSLRG
ncbi:polysaccharide pyruvyl transferase family protein, partial [Patescibacteria group bacterium]|nr:polysaccharide pyruvyl transferase family protein [Patescibacteria group bacterium]